MKRRTVMAVGAATFAAMGSSVAIGGSQPTKNSHEPEDWYVIAYALMQKDVFDPIAKTLKSYPDKDQLEGRLAGCIEEIRKKGRIAELVLRRDDFFLGIKSDPGGQTEQVLFVRIPQTAALFESLTKRFGATPSFIDGAKITVI